MIQRKHATSLKFALEGFFFAVREHPSFKVHSAATVLVFFGAFWLRFSLWEWAILLLTVGLVWALELINTAIETLTDFISPTYSKQAKIVKDISAGAVLIVVLVSVLIGFLLFLPKVLI